MSRYEQLGPKYTVTMPDGTETTYESLGQMLRVLAAHPGAEPDWGALSESETRLARTFVARDGGAS